MRSWLRGSFVLFVLALLVSCASTPGVRVTQTSPAPPHVLPPIQVVSEQESDRWASQHALATQGLAVVNEPYAWTLRVVSTRSWESRRDEDLFCDPWLARRAYWGWYDPWHRPYAYGPCGRPTRERTFEVRTLTWSLVDDRGALRWHASTRQSRPGGPPVEEALRLAASLRKWSDAGQM